MEDKIREMIKEWREQSDYSFAIGDVSASTAWSRAADDLEELIK